MEINWKFNIGDIVSTKVLLLEMKMQAKLEKKITWYTPLSINERRSVECCGGLQLFYSCEINGKYMQYAEDSLIPINDFYDAVLEEYFKITSKDT